MGLFSDRAEEHQAVPMPEGAGAVGLRAAPTVLGSMELSERLRSIEQAVGAVLHRNVGATSELPPINVIMPVPVNCPVCGGKGGAEVATWVRRRTLREGVALPSGWGEREAEEAGVLHEFYLEDDVATPPRFKACGPCLGTGIARPARQEIVLRMVRG